MEGVTKFRLADFVVSDLVSIGSPRFDRKKVGKRFKEKGSCGDLYLDCGRGGTSRSMLRKPQF